MKYVGKKLVIFAVGIAVLCPLASAQPATRATQPADTETHPVSQKAGNDLENRRVGRNGGPDIRPWLQTILALAAVVGLIFLARWVLRKVGSPVGPARHTDIIEILARSSLPPRHRLFLVRVGRKLVLLGAGPQGLAALTEITDPDEVSRLIEAAKGGGGGRKPPADNSVRGVTEKIRSHLSAKDRTQ